MPNPIVTDAAGNEYEHLEYTPYGELFLEQARDGLESLPYRFTGKELDVETGLYYYGARYLDPKTSRWLSSDPALGEYIPAAPVNDDARKHNQNLPGQGGVFNTVNLHVYHYAGNNPVKYIDPDGRDVEEVISGSVSGGVLLVGKIQVSIIRNPDYIWDLGLAITIRGGMGFGIAVGGDKTSPYDNIDLGLELQGFERPMYAHDLEKGIKFSINPFEVEAGVGVGVDSVRDSTHEDSSDRSMSLVPVIGAKAASYHAEVTKVLTLGDAVEFLYDVTCGPLVFIGLLPPVDLTPKTQGKME